MSLFTSPNSTSIRETCSSTESSRAKLSQILLQLRCSRSHLHTLHTRSRESEETRGRHDTRHTRSRNSEENARAFHNHRLGVSRMATLHTLPRESEENAGVTFHNHRLRISRMATLHDTRARANPKKCESVSQPPTESQPHGTEYSVRPRSVSMVIHY